MTNEYSLMDVDESKYKNNILNTINGYISDGTTSDCEYIYEYDENQSYYNNLANFVDSSDDEKKNDYTIDSTDSNDKLKKEDFSEKALERLDNFIKGKLTNKIILYEVKPEKKELFKLFMKSSKCY